MTGFNGTECRCGRGPGYSKHTIWVVIKFDDEELLIEYHGYDDIKFDDT